ncbi:MAG: 30S ribosomal protein S15 [Arsenophonus sp.]|nr:MAG: 30S ribosomal protein S15 [Arsenophonus sp.]
MSISNDLKKKIILKYGKTKYDSGSSEVQIALLTEKINSLKDHFMKHSKDYHSRIGLLRMVSHRRSQLNYLKKKKIVIYNKLIESLGLRR